MVGPTSLYDSEFEYLGAALRHLNDHKGAGLDFDRYDEDETVRLTASDEIKERFRRLPDEAWPEDGVFFLSADPDAVQQSIADARKEEHAWPRVQYLWRQHPLSQWASDKVVANFRRNEAPVLSSDPRRGRNRCRLLGKCAQPQGPAGRQRLGGRAILEGPGAGDPDLRGGAAGDRPGCAATLQPGAGCGPRGPPGPGADGGRSRPRLDGDAATREKRLAQ